MTQEDEEEEGSPDAAADGGILELVAPLGEDAGSGFDLAGFDLGRSALDRGGYSSFLGRRGDGRILAGLDLVAALSGDVFVVRDDPAFGELVPERPVSDDRSDESDEGGEREVDAKYGRSVFHRKKERDKLFGGARKGLEDVLVFGGIGVVEIESDGHEVEVLSAELRGLKELLLRSGFVVLRLEEDDEALVVVGESDCSIAEFHVFQVSSGRERLIDDAVFPGGHFRVGVGSEFVGEDEEVVRESRGNIR